MKVYVLDENQISDLIDKSVNAALSKLNKASDDSRLPEIIKMPMAIKVLGIGRAKILKMVSSGTLKMISKRGEKYRFRKADLLNIKGL